jgi:LAGLIDADG endonuclease
VKFLKEKKRSLLYCCQHFSSLFLLLRNIKLNNQSNNNLNSELGHYLAGLIESDGAIIVPKIGSKNTPTISISFHICDKPLTQRLKERLGYSSIEIIENRKAVRLHIRGKYSLLNMVSLINGKFRTPKIEKLGKLIEYININ